MRYINEKVECKSVVLALIGALISDLFLYNTKMGSFNLPNILGINRR